MDVWGGAFSSWGARMNICTQSKMKIFPLNAEIGTFEFFGTDGICNMILPDYLVQPTTGVFVLEKSAHLRFSVFVKVKTKNKEV